MATTKKAPATWQDLQARGGPYSPEEQRVLYDRPGMHPIGSHAWGCETCGRVVGTYTSAQVNDYYRSKGTLQEKTMPAPPQHIQELEARATHCEGVVRGIGQDLGEAYGELAKLEAARRRAGEARETGRPSESPQEEAIRAARTQDVTARIARLKDAHLEAVIVRTEASDQYMQAFAQWREELRQEEERANRVAAGLEPEPQPKVSQLERWLSGRKSA